MTYFLAAEHIAMSIDYNQEMTAINAELQNQRPQILSLIHI